MTEIRRFEEGDWPAIWEIMEPVFRAGETYPLPLDITEPEARKIWVETPTAAFVAVDDNNQVLGTYFIKPNHQGPGAHVCNCGYIVSEKARNQGIASEMCQHSQCEATARGFEAMQFNMVVSTNTGAVKLWKRLGFKIAGTLPQAFRHPRLGLVDAFVMYKQLKT
jgi:ribosomal protein S18 acetylase RimI-like enzyme